ncbi:hypothetical protein [Bradyrhizobium sp. RDM4]|uniref:hypothetical protein n=1 Tax=Bradyrhizobium sp. RDM4 TaxID=3378765 RepID=UPI0038FC2022
MTHVGVQQPIALGICCESRKLSGKSYPDYARQFLGDYRNAPDVVAWARSETDIVAVYEPEVGSTFNGSISLDLTRARQDFGG